MLLSICLIVKDEEEVLSRCLESVREAADEIIVVDTGSTDKTKEVAAEFTDKIYDFEWVKDFSAARNESLRYAAGTWILVMDADEYFASGDAIKLRNFLTTITPREDQVFAVNISSFLGKDRTTAILSAGEVPRLFPNHFSIKYYRPIHEQLLSETGIKLHSFLAPVSLFHTGYLKETIQSKSKSSRNAELLTSIKKKDGFAPYDFFTAGNEFAVKADMPKAIYYFEKAIKSGTKHKTASWYPKAVISLTQCYCRQFRYFDALNLLERELIKWKDYPEYSYLKANILHYLGFIKEAQKHYLDALNVSLVKAELTHVFWLDSAEFATTMPMRRLAAIYENEGDLQNAVYYWSKLLHQDLYDFTSLHSLLNTLIHYESMDKIIFLLGQIYQVDDLKHIYILFRSSLTVRSAELAKHYYNLLLNKEFTVSIADQIFYSIVQKDQAHYSNCTNHPDYKPSNEHYTHEAIACRVWGLEIPLYRPNSSEDVSEKIQKKLNHVKAILELQEEAHTVAVNEYPELLLTILQSAYLLQEFEIYDQLIQTYSDDNIINEMANFLYSRKNESIALDYYSILLNKNALDARSCENLAMYHFKGDDIEGGLAFLEEAIRLQPQTIYLYVQYLERSNNQNKRSKIKDKLLRQFAGAVRIPEFALLLKN
ncbi:glycosyltransferase family 2 protein [Paenibacillus herberti]|uniref:Glycosyltransferase 2-like domain-containing protein n=1 Tax=Paenibacillus herberti TaxID=1619309 RepID=A0A229NW82_9BACL|nr:glycosyltransferase family 2 protein [Paenibacillus herberti]OXM14122.1 hypothetical protein CGZ75_14195 [Paenibacillus herberti]